MASSINAPSLGWQIANFIMFGDRRGVKGTYKKIQEGLRHAPLTIVALLGAITVLGLYLSHSKAFDELSHFLVEKKVKMLMTTAIVGSIIFMLRCGIWSYDWRMSTDYTRAMIELGKLRVRVEDMRQNFRYNEKDEYLRLVEELDQKTQELREFSYWFDEKNVNNTTSHDEED